MNESQHKPIDRILTPKYKINTYTQSYSIHFSKNAVQKGCQNESIKKSGKKKATKKK